MAAKLQDVIRKLRSQYGEPRPPKINHPLALILYENVGYLVDDQKREVAFAALKNQIGLEAIDILATPVEKLVQITRQGGIHPQLRAARLKEIAQIVLNDFGGDLRRALKLPPAKALQQLKKFPSIGTPGAQKILLFTRTHPILALDSNGLRVMLRLGFGAERKSYSSSYASVQEAINEQLPIDYDFLITAHLLLRHHGKQICRSNNPLCPECPLKSVCRYYQNVH